MANTRKIKKRDGKIVDFDSSKITHAISKAFECVGAPNFELAQNLSKKVVEKLKRKLRPRQVPTVEQIQDIVEQTLVEQGQAKIAKAYILYRQKRTEVRKQKQQILQKTEIDEIDKRFDLNALRVLCSRYLRKNESSRVVESPKQLFERVAVHTTLPSIFFDKKIFQKKGGSFYPSEEFDPKSHENKFKIGRFALNRFHLDGLKRIYDRFNARGQMRVKFSELLKLLKKGEFAKYEKEIEQYYNLMAQRKFFPNTPALANFGNFLGMGSACFHPSQLIITKDGPRKISSIKKEDFVLTHNKKFKKVTETFKRAVEEDIYQIKVWKLPNPTLLVTKEHPILIYKDGKKVWEKAQNIKKDDYIVLSYPEEVIDVPEIKIENYVRGLEKKGELVFYTYQGGKFNAFKHETTAVKNEITVDYDLMKLFGFYLAEGCVSEHRCLRFTFSSNERSFAEEVLRIVKEKFDVDSRIEGTNNPNRNWVSVRFHSTILARLFEGLFGTGFNRKRIPDWVLTLPQNKQLGLLYGMLRGDGTLFMNGNIPNAKVVMCNKDLIYGFWQICMRLNVFPCLNIAKIPKLGNENPVVCTVGGGHDTFLVGIYGQETISALVNTKTAYYKNPFHLKLSDGTVAARVMNIEKITYSGSVYNLEVEDDHSYVANMVSVHNCFVLPVEDSIESIMDALKSAAIIFRSGGGVGYNFSNLRPEGDRVTTTHGTSTGPLSFMTLFDKMSEVIKQGGIRRGASMGILNSDHPDVEKFITAKKGNRQLRNFNISVFIHSDFWDYYEKRKPYPLKNPRNGEVIKYVDPQNLFSLIIYQAWESGEPGVVFDEHINKYNPFLKTLGPITCTNPCGELPLFPYGSCNLGSINVWAFCKSNPSNGKEKEVEFDWESFKQTIKLATKFLDNVIEVNNFPLKEIEEMTLNMRRIGLGIMGLADVLYELGISYNSSEGLDFMERLMEFLNYHSKVVSIELAKKRGKFPYYEKSFYSQGKLPFPGREEKAGRLPLGKKDDLQLDWEGLREDIKKYGLRNAQTTTNAPTGSVSMIAGCASGVEPNFSLVYEKRVVIGSFYYINPVFEKVMEREGLFDEDLIKEVSDRRGSIKDLKYIPPKFKEVFVTAMDISAQDHIRALAVLQKWTDSSISKTINFPQQASIDDMREAYLLAHKLGCKDLTVFRDQSIKGVLRAGARKEKKPKPEGELVSLKDVKAKGPVIYHDVSVEHVPPFKENAGENNTCPNCSTPLIMSEGCKKCPKCGWGICTG